MNTEIEAAVEIDIISQTSKINAKEAP